jgi:L-ascorbate metabolism protein UlaG (beta-lactamase superfamily)
MMRITLIGHSSILIEAGGKQLLTDPFLNTWGNPAYARADRPARSREALREVDAVLVSHDHWDHTDPAYLRMLAPTTPVLAPKLSSWLVRLFSGHPVTGMAVGEMRRFGDVSVTAVPAVHLTATVGFVIEAEDRQVYFAGDTFYRPFMEALGRQYKLDVALMPVTTYRMPMTMDEGQAVRAVQALEPAVVIPIHQGIRPRSPLLRTSQTPQRFAQRLIDSGSAAKVIILRPGESYSL